MPCAIKLFAEPVLEAAAVPDPVADDEAIADAEASAAVGDADPDMDVAMLEVAAVLLLDAESGHVGVGRFVTPAVRQS